MKSLFASALFLLCAIGLSLGGETTVEEEDAAISQLILDLRNALEKKVGETAIDEGSKRTVKTQDGAENGGFEELLERSVEERAKDQAFDLARAVRGGWDDLKVSIKKAGQKVKNAFGKKEAEKKREMEAKVEMEAKMQVEAKTEMEARVQVKAKEEMEAKVQVGAKNEMEAKVQVGEKKEMEAKVEKEKNVKMEAKAEKEAEKRAETAVEMETKAEKEAEAKAQEEVELEAKEEMEAVEVEIIELARREQELNDLQERLKRAHYLIKEALYKREMEKEEQRREEELEEEEKEEEEEEEEEEEQEERKRSMETRGAWDDFKQKLRKMKFKLKERLGKRSNANLRTIKRNLAELQAIKSALAALKRDALDAGMEKDPEIIKLIQETEAMAHQLEAKEG